VERKNIKEEGKEGRWENLLLLPDTHTCALGTGHTLVIIKTEMSEYICSTEKC
jgi:hypothetical protein